MAINTSTVETNLTTKLNATSGSTDAKEFLLLGKAVEALTPTTVSGVINEGTTIGLVTAEGNTQVTRVQNEGTTQVANVQAAGAGYAQLTGATFTGDVDFGSNKLPTQTSTHNWQTFISVTYHGMFAHVHATDKVLRTWWQLDAFS